MVINTIYLRSLALSTLIVFIVAIESTTSAEHTPKELKQYSNKVEYVCPPSDAIAPCSCGVDVQTGEVALDCLKKNLNDDSMSDI